MQPVIFTSADSGAPTLTGETGKLVEILSACLVCNKAFAAVSGASFLDRTTEARLRGGTAFTMFQTPGTSDEFYVGMTQKFGQIAFTLGTAASGGTFVWEYWNGSAWTSFSPTDGTTGFTVDGTVSWTISALTSWATTAVNSVTQFWVRVRLTATGATNPTINCLSITGWQEEFTGTSKRVYRSRNGVSRMYYRVQDDGPGVGTFKEARIRGFENMSDIDTGVAPNAGGFPLDAQVSNGLFIRKSAAADSTTRVWQLWADDRTCMFFALTGDNATAHLAFAMGEIESFVTADPYGAILIARATENSATITVDKLDALTATSAATVLAAHYMPRTHTGLGGSVQVGKLANGALQGNAAALFGLVPLPNAADGSLVTIPIFVNQVDNTLRGRLRGLWCQCHAISAFGDGDTAGGDPAGTLSGRTFKFVKNSGNAGIYTLETSDTIVNTP